MDLTHGWSLLAGLRLTDYRQKGFGADGARTSEYDKNGVLTPTLALMYNITPRTMAYASYIESLEAGSVVGNTYTNAGTLLDPLKSKQYEFGLKTEQDDWAATAALFRIEKRPKTPWWIPTAAARAWNRTACRATRAWSWPPRPGWPRTGTSAAA